ncbi:hypothetical protein CLU79DRAFT_839491 [Phycomyces nitens]|nr:hypothetical protein CLU79DRAFT_839491 [Phycomyces nitens]
MCQRSPDCTESNLCPKVHPSLLWFLGLQRGRSILSGDSNATAAEELLQDSGYPPNDFKYHHRGCLFTFGRHHVPPACLVLSLMSWILTIQKDKRIDINQKSACLHSFESIDLLDSREEVDVELSTSMYAEVMAELWSLTLANSCHQYIFESCGSDDPVLSKALALGRLNTSSRNQAKQVIESKRARMGSVEKLANIILIPDTDRPKHVKQINLYDSAKTKKNRALSDQVKNTQSSIFQESKYSRTTISNPNQDPEDPAQSLAISLGWVKAQQESRQNKLERS